MSSLANPFDAMFVEKAAAAPPKQEHDAFDLMAAFGDTTQSGTTTGTPSKKKEKPSAIRTETGLLSAPQTLASNTPSPKSSRSERRRRMSRSKSQTDSQSPTGSFDSEASTDPFDAFEEDEQQTNDPTIAARAIRRGSVAKQQPGLRGLRMSFSGEEKQSTTLSNSAAAASAAAAAAAADTTTDPAARPKNVLCPNCGMGNEVPHDKTFFNCGSCALEMVAKLSDVPKQSRLQCPNCSRSIVAPPNCDMFKCICGQTMVVPGSDMAKKIQQQGTRKGELIFVQDKSELYGAVHLRVTSKKIFKKWSTRFFSIQRGRILLFRNKLKAAQGCAALLTIGLHPRQKVSHIEDTTNKDIEHLHMMTLRENVSDRGSPTSSSGHGSYAFSDAQPNKIACELACDSLDGATQLKKKLDEMIHAMQEEMRRHD